jgi:hypothetical protein
MEPVEEALMATKKLRGAKDGKIKTCPKGWKKGLVPFFQPWDSKRPNAVHGCLRGRFGIRRPLEFSVSSRKKIKNLKVKNSGFVVEDVKNQSVTMPNTAAKEGAFKTLEQAVCAADHMERVGVKGASGGSGGPFGMNHWKVTLAHRGFASKMCRTKKKPKYEDMRGSGLWSIGYIDELLKELLKQCERKLKELRKGKKKSRS